MHFFTGIHRDYHRPSDDVEKVDIVGLRRISSMVADIAEQIWSVPESVAELSTLFELAPGDLLFTGTPAGVGPVVSGDHLHGGIDGIDEIEITIV